MDCREKYPTLCQVVIPADHTPCARWRGCLSFFSEGFLPRPWSTRCSPSTRICTTADGSSLVRQVGLDKPARLIIRLLFGFNKLNQSTNRYGNAVRLDDPMAPVHMGPRVSEVERNLVRFESQRRTHSTVFARFSNLKAEAETSDYPVGSLPWAIQDRNRNASLNKLLSLTACSGSWLPYSTYLHLGFFYVS